MILSECRFFSGTLGMCMAANVLLPYGEGPHKTLWLLHGAGDDHTAWLRYTNVERYAQAKNIAVVMVNAHLSSYIDMAHGGKYFTYVTEELPEKLRGFFNLSDKRDDNYIAGLSMGGAGAFRIALARPEKYSAVAVFSAGLSNKRHDEAATRASKRHEMIYGDLPIEGTEKDPWGNARAIAERGAVAPRIWHYCGTEDFMLPNAREARDFFNSLPEGSVRYEYRECPGGHDWDFWDARIREFIETLG